MLHRLDRGLPPPLPFVKDKIFAEEGLTFFLGNLPSHIMQRKPKKVLYQRALALLRTFIKSAMVGFKTLHLLAHSQSSTLQMVLDVLVALQHCGVWWPSGLNCFARLSRH